MHSCIALSFDRTPGDMLSFSYCSIARALPHLTKVLFESFRINPHDHEASYRKKDILDVLIKIPHHFFVDSIIVFSTATTFHYVDMHIDRWNIV